MNWTRTGKSSGNWECRKPWVATDEGPILGSSYTTDCFENIWVTIWGPWLQTIAVWKTCQRNLLRGLEAAGFVVPARVIHRKE